MIDFSTRKCKVLTHLNDYCYFASKEDTVELVEWGNTEGFDIEIIGKEIKRFSLTYGEFKAIQALVLYENSDEPT